MTGKRPMKKSRIDTKKKRNRKADVQTKPKREAKGWRETLYNCPCLLLLVATTLAAMLCSDEIGINIIPAGRAVIVKAVEMNGTASTVEAAEETDVPGEGETDGESAETEKIGQELNAVVADTAEQIPVEDNGENSGQTIEEEEKPKTGITRFEYYEPQEIESGYYSDAGKVAMTTEYDYTLENDSYFNDAAFLGDSRTLGISDYAGLDGADFYCDSGMTIFKLLGEDGVTYQKTGKKVDLKQVLQEKQYGKIYIMLGMNELGYGNTEMYLKQYRELVEQIRQWQPEAIIFIMANLHVSEEKNDPETEFNNININDKNAASALLANGTDIFYLDSNPLFTDEGGFLNAESTFDGVHLYAQYYDTWRQFLFEHGVERPVTEENGQRSITTEEPEMQKITDGKAGNAENDGNAVE